MDYLLIFLNIGTLWQYMVSSIFIPFYPPLAESKGLSNTLIGIIFIFSPIGSTISSFILGKAMNNVSIKLFKAK